MKRIISGGSNNGIVGIDSHYDMPHLTPFLRQVDWHGGYTAAAGHNFYTARSFPKSYWNRIAFVAEPTGRVLHKAIIEKDGSGFKEKNGFNILASSDEWFSPVHAEVGPDGALWIADWYNFIIQHNPTPKGFDNGEGNAYINPLRDSKHGRIYRLAYKGAPEYKPVVIDPTKKKDLIAGLKHDNMFWRLTAQKLIVENQNQDVIEDLYDLIENRNVDEIGLNTPAIHALWTLHGLGALDGSNPNATKIVNRALNHPSAGVRKNAIEVLPPTEATLQAILAAKLHQDKDLNTRKAAFLALADVPTSSQVSDLIYEASLVAENANDNFLPQAIFAGVVAHPAYFNANIQSLLPKEKPDSLFSLTERLSKSLVEEEYNLDRRAAIPFPPDVSNKEIYLRAELTKANDGLTGVIVAQGDRQNGYSLYLQDNAVHWLVRQNGKAFKVSSAKNLPIDQFMVFANLLEDGSMSLQINDGKIIEGKANALFSEPITPATIRVGFDNLRENNVGDYPEPTWMRGRLGRNSYLSLRDPSVTMENLTASVGNEASGVSRENATVIKMGVIPHEMKFDKASFTVKAGAQVIIDFENGDFMQHNLIISQIGSLEKIGKAADEMARDPKGIEKNFIPEIPEIITASRLVDPEATESLVFKAPMQPGEYPYVCTVPGHWRIMNGKMIVQ